MVCQSSFPSASEFRLRSAVNMLCNWPTRAGNTCSGILGKLQQAQPVKPVRGTSRGNRTRSREAPANGGRRSSRFQTNQDIFGDDVMDYYHQQHGRY